MLILVIVFSDVQIFSLQLGLVMCRYSEFHPHLFHQHSKLDPEPLEFESFNKVCADRQIGHFSYWQEYI